MPGLPRMAPRMPVRGRVAAADLAAALAHPKVDPATSGREAVLAPPDRFGQRNDGDPVEVATGDGVQARKCCKSRTRAALQLATQASGLYFLGGSDRA